MGFGGAKPTRAEAVLVDVLVEVRSASREGVGAFIHAALQSARSVRAVGGAPFIP